jgi:hypothetical protein
MERCVSVIKRAAWPRLLAIALLLSSSLPAFGADHVVLIANVRNPVNELNSLQVQKLFLGLTVTVAGNDLRPLRNESDDIMRQIFYQNIISMAESTYERRMLALTMQQGRTAPPVYRSKQALLSAVAADSAAVSFAWAGDIAADPRFKIIGVLGQE